MLQRCSGGSLAKVPGEMSGEMHNRAVARVRTFDSEKDLVTKGNLLRANSSRELRASIIVILGLRVPGD